MVFIAVDPGTLIWTVGEVRPRFRTPPPPPLLKGRKARGVRNLLCAVDLGAQIWTARSCLLLTTGALSPETLDKWVFTPSFALYPPYTRNIANTSSNICFSLLGSNSSIFYVALLTLDPSVVLSGVTLCSPVTLPPLVIATTLGSSPRGLVDISCTCWFPPCLSWSLASSTGQSSITCSNEL
jgi:hypothetical protein